MSPGAGTAASGACWSACHPGAPSPRLCSRHPRALPKQARSLPLSLPPPPPRSRVHSPGLPAQKSSRGSEKKPKAVVAAHEAPGACGQTERRRRRAEGELVRRWRSCGAVAHSGRRRRQHGQRQARRQGAEAGRGRAGQGSSSSRAAHQGGGLGCQRILDAHKLPAGADSEETEGKRGGRAHALANRRLGVPPRPAAPPLSVC